MGCPKSKFPYAVKNQKNSLKILKKLYFISFEYIIFPHSRQKESSIYHTLGLIIVCSIDRTACPNLSQYARSTFVKVGLPNCCSLSFSALVMLNDYLRCVARIVLTDLSITTFGRPMHDLSCTMHRPSQNSRLHSFTICMLRTSLPYTSVSCL